KEDFALPPIDCPVPLNPWTGLAQSCRAWTWPTPKGAGVIGLHQEFGQYGLWWQRAYRTGLLVVLNLALFALLWLLFDPTVIQARGEIARWCYGLVLIFTLFALAGLLMFVVDSTLLSYRFVTSLVRQSPRTWPDTLVDDRAADWGFDLKNATKADA